jgi:hypothetical protein
MVFPQQKGEWMKLLKNVSLVALMSTLTACAAGPQTYSSARQTLQSSKYTIGTLQDSMASDHMHRFLDKEHRVFYMQNQGGGGAAVGVLLGPLGVLANVAAIKSQTNKDAAQLQDKLSIDVAAIFRDSLNQSAALTQSTQSGVDPELSPVLYVEKLDDDHIRFASMLIVTAHAAGKSILRQYIYELPDSYTKQSLTQGLTNEQLARLGADAKVGFDWIAATYTQDIEGTFKPMTKAVIHSDFVTPRTQIPYGGYSFDAGAGRVGFATQTVATTTIYSLPQDAATLTL